MDPGALGRYLRESREARELTLEDAVRSLRIRRDILESFEQGEFNIMDSAIRVRGMLRNYAKFLGLEEERVLQYYETAVNTKRRRRFGRRDTHAVPVAPQKITDTPPTLPKVVLTEAENTSRIVNMLRNTAIFLVSIASIALIIFVLTDMLEFNQPDEVVAVLPTLPSGTITVTPTNTATITPRATIPTDTPDAASLNIVGIQVILELQQRSWVRILVDDIESYAGILEPGYSATYTGNTSVAITAANAAALEITYNGIMQSAFGARGQEVELLFTSTGINIMQNDGQNDTVATNVIQQIQEVTEALPTATLSATNTQAVQIAPTAITQGNIVTPTPLFSQTENLAPTALESTESVSAPIASPVSHTATPIATASPQATIEPTITNTATSSAILPRRETPSNPTATKTG